jgi:hypothetical protein
VGFRAIRQRRNLELKISTAILWMRRFRKTGSVKPDQIGG